MKNVLFLCSRNRLRSPTAEEIFRGHPGIDVDSAGLAADADVRLSADQIEWADVIIVMETIHKRNLNRKFRKELGGKRIVVLGIPDNYKFMEAGLVDLLRLKCLPHLL